MKKFTAVLLLLTVMLVSAFAADVADLDIPSGITVQEPFYPMSPKVMGMGGAGLAVPGRTDSFFLNPAGLAKRPGTKFQLSLPYFEVTLFNVADMVRPDAETKKSFINKVMDLMNNTEDTQAMVDLGLDFLGMLKTGKNKLAKIDTGISFMGGGFGLATNVRATVHDWGAGSGSVDSQLFAEVEAAQTMAYAHRFNVGEKFSIDFGGAIRFNYLAFTGLVGAKDVLNFAMPAEGTEPQTPDQFLGTIPMMAGWQVAGDLGLNFNLPLGFSLGVVARNLGTQYNMYMFDSLTEFPSLFVSSFLDTNIKIASPWSLDFGFGWKWDNTWFKPRLAVDFVDGIGLFTRDADKLGDFRTWLAHARIGLDLRLLACLEVRAGLNQGYWSLGGGVDIGMINVEAAYYVVEGGNKLGDKPADAFTVRVNIGFDR